MFPDLNQLEHNQALSGKVFRVLVKSLGIGVNGSKVEINREQWEQCLACEAYRGCYDLSAGTLALNHALAGI